MATSSVANAFLTPPNSHQQMQQHRQRRTNRSILQGSEDSSSKESSDLLEKAKKLREEAQRLEQNLRESPSTNRRSAASDAAKPASAPTKLEDSAWTFSYRFSSQPKDEDADGVILPNYAGKLTIRLTPDGYSEVVSNEENQLRIGKVWGWDEELSQEDQNKYLLLSMDVQFPETDPLMAERIERCYLQARVDRDPTDGTIALKEGTVTVKKDVSDMTKGMWGIFQVSGILTQFRYVGDFSSKPASSSRDSSN